MSGTSVISARELRKDYGKGTGLTHAVAGIDLDVMTGETMAITGPSGCGKSTLLHLLSGLDRPSDGTVLLAGRRVDQMGERGLAPLRRGVTGFVFQSFQLMDELTAVENVELADAPGRAVGAVGAAAGHGPARAGSAGRPGPARAVDAVRRPAAARCRRDRQGSGGCKAGQSWLGRIVSRRRRFL